MTMSETNVEVLTANQCQSKIDALLTELGMTWDQAVEASLEYTLNAHQRGIVQHVNGLRFLLDLPGVPCCRTCQEMDAADE